MPFSPPKVVSFTTWPFSMLYGAITNVRNRGFDSGIKKIYKLSKPVISVGNITIGGTGKTPVVVYLSEMLNKQGLKVAVLTRGYKRQSKATIVLTKDNLCRVPFKDTGDEARVLAKHIDNGGVVIDRNRFRGGNIALKKFDPDIFILDDGFQHRQLNRDLDIVTLDGRYPFGNAFILPSGPLRESIKNLKRANLFWITRSDQPGFMIEKFQQQLNDFSTKPIVFSNHEPTQVIHATKQSELPVGFLKDKNVVAFAGIANPNSFLESLKEIGANVVSFIKFRDHYHYSVKNIDEFIQTQAQYNAEILVTTEKDAVRFSPEMLHKMPNLHYLQISIRLAQGGEELKKILKHINIF